LALSLLTLPLSAQNSPAPAVPSPISQSEATQTRFDLSTLIAQRNYWKDRSDSFEQAGTKLSARLAILEQLLKDSPDPSLMQAEIADLRTQLADALSSLAGSKVILDSLDQRIAAAADKIAAAEARAKSLERENVILKVVTIVTAALAMAAGIYAAVK
jgi:chromosome segregation ATPase